MHLAFPCYQPEYYPVVRCSYISQLTRFYRPTQKALSSMRCTLLARVLLLLRRFLAPRSAAQHSAPPPPPAAPPAARQARPPLPGSGKKRGSTMVNAGQRWSTLGSAGRRLTSARAHAMSMRSEPLAMLRHTTAAASQRAAHFRRCKRGDCAISANFFPARCLASASRRARQTFLDPTKLWAVQSLILR